ncbi:MAG TPA: hypothetical protein VF945_17335, partial [Polyangia bacterium]
MQARPSVVLVLFASACHIPAATGGAPASLSETGLYADGGSATVRTDVRPYTPGYEMWSDGAAKSRWIYLP